MAFEARMAYTTVGTGGGIFIDQFSMTMLPDTLKATEWRPGDATVYDHQSHTGANKEISATFNKPIYQGAEYDKITIVDSVTGVNYATGKSIDGNKLTLNVSQLGDEKTYVVTIPADALEGLFDTVSWTFKTNIMAPIWYAESFSPRNMQNPTAVYTGLGIDQEMSITFDCNNLEATSPEALTDSIKIYKIADADSNVRLGEVTGVYGTIDGKTLTIHHNMLDELAFYEVVVPLKVIKHATHNTVTSFVPGRKNWAYKTREYQISYESSIPEDNETNVAVDAPVSITFSGVIVKTDALDRVFIKKTDSPDTLLNVVATVDSNDLRVMRIAHPDFEENTRYSVIVPAGTVNNPGQAGMVFTTTSGGSSIKTKLPESTFNVYPNPVADVLNIQTKETVKRIEIFNLQGQLLKVVEGAKQEVSVAGLSAGTYLLKLTTDKGVASQRFIKH